MKNILMIIIISLKKKIDNILYKIKKNKYKNNDKLYNKLKKLKKTIYIKYL